MLHINNFQCATANILYDSDTAGKSKGYMSNHSDSQTCTHNSTVKGVKIIESQTQTTCYNLRQDTFGAGQLLCLCN